MHRVSAGVDAAIGGATEYLSSCTCADPHLAEGLSAATPSAASAVVLVAHRIDAALTAERLSRHRAALVGSFAAPGDAALSIRADIPTSATVVAVILGKNTEVAAKELARGALCGLFFSPTRSDQER